MASYTNTFTETELEADFAIAVQAQAAILPYFYTSPQRVAERLQVRNPSGLIAFDDSTRPTMYTVIDLIHEAEGRIDAETGHSWRQSFSYDPSDGNDYEVKHLAQEYDYLAGIPVNLNHRNVRQFSSGAGDVLQVWNGSTWYDYLANMTEGRANDYWVDYRLGKIYFRTYIYRKRPYSVRLRYRYGAYTIPDDIKRAATLLVCADVLRMDDRSALVAEGGNSITPTDKAKEFEELAYAIIARYKETAVAVL